MNIQTASIYAQQGYSIKRPSWNNNSYYLLSKEKGIHIENGFFKSGDSFIIILVEDLIADDWEIVK